VHPTNRFKQKWCNNLFFGLLIQTTTTHVNEIFPTILRCRPRCHDIPAIGQRGQQLARARFLVHTYRATGGFSVALDHTASSVVKAGTNNLRFQHCRVMYILVKLYPGNTACAKGDKTKPPNYHFDTEYCKRLPVTVCQD